MDYDRYTDSRATFSEKQAGTARLIRLCSRKSGLGINNFISNNNFITRCPHGSTSASFNLLYTPGIGSTGGPCQVLVYPYLDVLGKSGACLNNLLNTVMAAAPIAESFAPKPSLSEPQHGPIPLFEHHLKVLTDSYLSFFQERFVHSVSVIPIHRLTVALFPQKTYRGSVVSYIWCIVFRNTL
jgi:hypothetical protein